MGACAKDIALPVGHALAALLVVVGVIIVATSGESIAVRFLTAVVTLDVGARLALRR